MEYHKKTFGQKFIDYLGPKNYNLMPINIKKDVFFIEGNNRNYKNKKIYSYLVIFNTLINYSEIYLTLLVNISILIVCIDY